VFWGFLSKTLFALMPQLKTSLKKSTMPHGLLFYSFIYNAYLSLIQDVEQIFVIPATA
jgi:hypothetical protein